MRVVADRQIPFLNGVLEPYAKVEYLDGDAIDARVLQNADALLVRTRTNCNAALLTGSSVRFVGTATIGTDHMDTAWLDTQNIAWVNAPGCNADAVCQYIVATLLHVSQKHGLKLQDSTLGIIGVGAVGSRVAKAAQSLGMKVLQNDPPRAEKENRRNFESLSTLIVKSDFITVHTPLKKSGKHSTWRLVNGSFLSKIQPHSWIINSSRGSVVDNTALRIALRSNSMGGAVLDVWENEPDNIDLDLLPLLELATPHIAGYSVEGKANATTQMVRAFAKTFGISALEKWAVPADALDVTPGGFIDLDGASGPDEALLHQAVRMVYDIASDDSDLRNDPAAFEHLRSKYAFRREFPAFTVKLRNSRPTLLAKLQGLGFAVTTS